MIGVELEIEYKWNNIRFLTDLPAFLAAWCLSAQWEKSEPRNIIDLFGRDNIYRWKAVGDRIMVRDDEPATPKSGRSGKRKRRMSIQVRGRGGTVGGGDKLAFEDEGCMLNRRFLLPLRPLLGIAGSSSRTTIRSHTAFQR
ncbi:hypothetical protein E4U57_001843 [Claviceps arundinis]|uniref:Uncharacterized protein n=1 Tax=Claviceps arundinis TaxID=1623583 RepID=A0ABQ7P9Q8_9HYPO|nr:hypothetical protein E4U57_001843 [Claviceps arundinis]